MSRKDKRRSCRELIEGVGVREMAAASLSTRFPVKESAVHKWKVSGFPSQHIPLVMRLAGASAAEVVSANEAARAAELEAA